MGSRREYTRILAIKGVLRRARGMRFALLGYPRPLDHTSPASNSAGRRSRSSSERSIVVAARAASR